jgi:hypothetical protein
MFISEIKNILDTKTISKVFNIIREAKFVDGRISGGLERSKYNLELYLSRRRTWMCCKSSSWLCERATNLTLPLSRDI